MKWITHLVALALGAALFWVSTSVRIVPSDDPELTNVAIRAMEVTYSDFVSVLLTVVTIVLAAVAVGIAVVAAYTVSTIKEDARDAVNTAVDNRLEGLKADVAKIAFRGQSVEELEAGFDPNENEEER